MKNAQKDEALPINRSDFDPIYKKLFDLEKIREQNFLLTTLRQSSYETKGNRLILTVSNDLARKKIESERDFIVAFLREQTGNHTIVLDTVVEEGFINEEVRAMTFTNDDKKRMMQEKNPALMLLEQTFNTFLT